MEAGVRTEITLELDQWLVYMGELVKRAVAQANRSLLEKAPALAEDAASSGYAIKQIRLEITRRCVPLLADCRRLESGERRRAAATLHVARELERIGELAASIAASSRETSPEWPPHIAPPIEKMTEHASEMVAISLRAFVAHDVRGLCRLWTHDGRLRAAQRWLHEEVLPRVGFSFWHSGALLPLLSAADRVRHIADHAVRIGQWAAYCDAQEPARLRADGSQDASARPCVRRSLVAAVPATNRAAAVEHADTLLVRRQ
jgi:phosphate transport system protein